MVDPCDMAPPKALKAAWEQAGVISHAASWTRQMGGHSNPVWRVRDNTDDVICKLYHTNKSSPLFGNHPDHEVLALKALSGHGLAPDLISSLHSSAGPSVTYCYLAGPQWSGDVTAVAELLAKLHRQKIPEGLPVAPRLPQGIIAQTHLMQPARTSDVEQFLPPDACHLPIAENVFLHGDVVPGNLVQTDDGLRLIDWQCPAVGDPCLDIAIFLSPAMQIIYGHRPLTAVEISRFFDAYNQPDVAQRYQAFAPIFHYRMAAYCRWKGARGSAAHAAAAPIEQSAISRA